MNTAIVKAPCIDCGDTVLRAASIEATSPEWREHVRCVTCRDADGSADDQIAQMLSENARQHWRRTVTGFDASAGFEHAQLDPTSDQAWQQRARAALNTWQDQQQTTSRSGLMLCGPTGIGKTWAAFAVANTVASLGFGDKIRVATETELLGAQVAAWDLEARLSRWVEGASVLVIDDIGVAARHRDQVQSGWKLLADLISALPRSVLVVGTSNRQSWTKEGGLAEWMGQQAASRMRSWTAICTTGAIDRRTNERHENWARQTSRG